MKRRDFIKYSIPASTIPLMISAMPGHAVANTQLLDLIAQTPNDKVLVIVQLNGGNDGLNMVIPIDQYAGLSQVRPNLLIAENKVLKLANTTVTGLHPVMTGIQKIHDQGKVRFLHDVGYPEPNYSHFRSLDIWLEAPNPTSQVIPTGWLGRFLDMEYPGFPEGYPNSQYPDPPAIQLGDVVSSALLGQVSVDGIAINNPGNFAQIEKGTNQDDVPPITAYGRELQYVRLLTLQTQKYTDAVKAALIKGAILSPFWPQPAGGLAYQMQLVAQMIAGGLKTKVYMVQQGGYDTHFNQVLAGQTDQGNHANLLKDLSDAIYAFQDEMRRHTLEDRVVGFTFSEFGRRIKSNGSLGSDHGAAAPMIAFGSQVIPGFLGKNSPIGSGVTVSDNLVMQTDFRQVYNSILKDWFGLTDAQLATVLFKNWPYVEIIKQPGKTYAFNKPDVIGQNMPNPFHAITTIPFYAQSGRTLIELWDPLGRKVRTILDANFQEGSNTVQFDGRDLASGIYYYKIQTGVHTKTLPMIKA